MTVKNSAENIHDLDILEEIENNPDATQATMANQMNVAIGTVNWHLKRLIEKGFVKIQRCEKRKLKYIITPEGISLRAKLTLDYIHTSFELYRLIRQRMNAVLDKCIDGSFSDIYIDGTGDVRDICRLTSMERGINVLEDPLPEFPVVRIVGLKLFYEEPAEYIGKDPFNSQNDDEPAEALEEAMA